MNEKEIFAAIMKACEEYTGFTGANIGSYWHLPYPQRLVTLNELLKWHLLREGGNIELFNRLAKGIEDLEGRQGSASDIALNKMMAWVEEELRVMRPLEVNTPRKKLVMGLLIWGDEYIDKLTNYMFKSLLAGNAEELANSRYTILHILTDKATMEKIGASWQYKALYDRGINPHFCLIPDDVMKADKYWLVGAASTLQVAFAKINNASFHHTFPDIIYSNKYFSEVLRLAQTHNIILQGAHRADEGMLMKALTPYMEETKLSISSEDLCSLGLNCMHLCEYHSLMNNRPAIESVPVSHKIYWETENALYIHNPHVNAVYISSESLKGMPHRFLHTLDSEMDIVSRGNNFYLPTPEDKFYILEMSNQSAFPMDDRYLHISEYGKFMWQVLAIKDSLKFFAKGSGVALNPSLRPTDRKVFREKQAKVEMDILKSLILAVDPYKGKVMARPRLHDEMYT